MTKGTNVAENMKTAELEQIHANRPQSKHRQAHG
jgi:hypothetical protein